MEDDPLVRQRPAKRATIALEEGRTDSSLEKQETGISSGGSGSNDEEKGLGGRRSMARDDNEPGLGGPGMGPPRRATMNTDPAEGRNLVRSFTSLFVPEHRLKPAPSVKQSIWNVVKYNYLNIVSCISVAPKGT